MSPWLGLTLGLALVIMNGFFVAAEFAIVKVRPTQIAPYVASGDRRGKMTQRLIDNLDAYLSACQLGITLASLGLGWIGEPAFARLIEPVVMRIPGASEALLHSISFALAFSTISALHIVIGELAPKSLAIRKPEPTSLWAAFPLHLFYVATKPAIWLLNSAANGFLKVLGIEPASEDELGHDEEELRRLLASAAPHRLSPTKRELLDNIFELSDRVARQVMVPRGDVVHLSTENDVEESLTLARESGHTRFPLCNGDLDHTVGLVHIKDLFRAGAPPTDLKDVMRPIAAVPETMPLDRLLKRMRAERHHMAVVLDEYGGASGIVTLENVIEEIVGQIQDEFDAERPDVLKQGDGLYLVSGALRIDELEQELGVEISDRNEDTLAGVVLSELGRSASEGDRVELGPLSIEVMEIDGNRITKLRVRRAETAA